MPDKHNTVRVWDPLVRVFHWTLAAAFLTAYLVEDDWLGLHIVAGYTVLGLVLFRLVWGALGTRHARFTDFVRSPDAVLAYLKDKLMNSMGDGGPARTRTWDQGNISAGI